MLTRGAALQLVMLLSWAGALQAAAAPAPKAALPPTLAAIKTAPADAERFTRTFDDQLGDPGDEGSEMPLAVYYSLPSDVGTFMAVTDLSLCKRPSEREICSAFRAIVEGRPPALGAEVTTSRIGGAGYISVFLARLDGVKLAGADSQAVFLAGDTQDPPGVGLAIYIYAQRGSNLIELSTRVGNCDFPAPESLPWTPADGKGGSRAEQKQRERVNAYYRQACVSPKIVAKARAAADQLAQSFRLAPPAQQR
jgi:hypothetical protein